MNIKLNKDLPYGQVMGLPGVCFEQNGLFFNYVGDPVELDKLDAINHEPTPPSPRDDTPILPAIVVESKEEENKKEEESFESMPLVELKALLATYDQPWTTKSDAIKFLKGQ